MRHKVFGQSVVTGLRALNPGLAKGTLRDIEDLHDLASVTPDSIVIVPETVAELPAVAGILTAHEGNNLSHVQLLARNLGIPNVVVQDNLLPSVKQHNGTQVVVAASPGGIVQIEKDNGQLDQYLVKTAEEIERTTIRVDVNKLNLEQTDFIGTDVLRGTDSGVLVGPKAAQVGELTYHFPNAVSPALAVPFGAFKQNLDRPVKPGGIPMFEHMVLEYDRLGAISDRQEKRRETSEFLAFVRNWITSSELSPSFRSRLRQALDNQFGADGSYGVFVRSDTNVEDLAGFTGAGLNLTIPNIVGADNIAEAIKEVWASPFTERAYGWRQGLMATPEHVYASVLLHKTIANEKSGVMVTADVENGERGYLSVVANEGVGGGVEGFSAETLRINVQTGEVLLLGSATASTRREVLSQGGSHLVPASGADRILTDQEIRQLIRLTDSMPGWFINLPPEERADVIADIEFGFLGGRLTLQQIRPYVESESAENNAYLRSLDAGLAHLDQVTVRLNEKPRKETL
jgi:phosphoenolpyruvate synthase/pyruvate phosphate dikinase